MISEDSKNEELERKGISWLSSMGGISPSSCLSTVNTSLETVLYRIEAGFQFDSLAVDVQELCIEVNRLVKHIESSGVCCSAETYRLLLTTLSRLRTAVTQVQRCSNTGQEPTRTSVHAHKIQTPRLPDDLSFALPCFQ
ncbi:hypothetical protein TraAM80_01551 [Trypanosoma rangeli]|uniref:Uncharacterized protein n=1 Tax=Trypanosoma rangeli TaxID=5698 RepID=A0A3R7NRH0_TRYRA|nr:uncharacterized protein TraAM80_01551 [Trypanosoma rangeli]RNF10504.1 hypothetical protein TraAM80_01551 [Trypanosoma rangeli]|eukprot:RNF10504.1 hypothetical protein TraAM80_01551 [Trypanosoma rangeli]